MAVHRFVQRKGRSGRRQSFADTRCFAHGDSNSATKPGGAATFVTGKSPKSGGAETNCAETNAGENDSVTVKTS